MEEEDPYFCGEEPPVEGYAEHMTQRFLDARAEWYCGCRCIICRDGYAHAMFVRYNPSPDYENWSILYYDLRCYEQDPIRAEKAIKRFDSLNSRVDLTNLDETDILSWKFKIVGET